MNETRHTPGDWTVQKDYGRIWISAGKGKKRVQVADVSDIETGRGSGEVDTDVAQTEANARLIAACPVMYEYTRCQAEKGDEDAAKIIASIG